jgi:hypothetical protein
VVRHDAHPHVLGIVGPVRVTRDLLGQGDDGKDLVDLVQVALALKDERDALEAGARVDGLRLQLAEQRIVLALTSPRTNWSKTRFQISR